MPDAVTGGNEPLRTDLAEAHKPRLLLILPIVPWPIRRSGYSLRFAPVIEYLAQRYELDVLVLAEEDEQPPSDRACQQYHALAVIKVPLTSLPRWLRTIRIVWYSVWPGPPLSASRYAADRLECALLSYLERKDYSVIIWGTRHLDVACRIRRRCPQTRFVMDIVDSPTLSSFRNVSTDLSVRMLRRYDGWKWRRLEKQVREVFDATIYISNIDAQAVRAGPAARVHVVPNGIFDADAPPLADVPPLADAPPLAEAPPSGRVIGFLGNMAYPPNISAALRLAQRIFPRILTRLADATLLIIGRDPGPEISQLAGPKICVTGTVDNIWPYIARASVFVFPMIEGTGLQNKILEAMYAGVPVVTTPIAANGMGARNGEQLLVAGTDEEITELVLKLLCDSAYGARLAERARAFVVREFSWPAILPRYEAIVAGDSSS